MSYSRPYSYLGGAPGLGLELALPTVQQPKLQTSQLSPVTTQSSYQAPTAFPTTTTRKPHSAEYANFAAVKVLLNAYINNLATLRPRVSGDNRIAVQAELRRAQKAQELSRKPMMHPNGWTTRDLAYLLDMQASGGLPDETDIALLRKIGPRGAVNTATSLKSTWEKIVASLKRRGRWPSAETAPPIRVDLNFRTGRAEVPGVTTGRDAARDAEAEVEAERRRLEEQREVEERLVREEAAAREEERMRREAEAAWTIDPESAPYMPESTTALLPAEGKKFPWVWVLGGAAALGVGGYLLTR